MTQDKVEAGEIEGWSRANESCPITRITQTPGAETILRELGEHPDEVPNLAPVIRFRRATAADQRIPRVG